MIDTHLHCWDRARSTYAWIPSGTAVDRDVDGDSAVAASRALGFDRQILVQADDSAGDTAAMLDVAASNDSVIGVVGWVPFDAPDVAEAILDDIGHRLVGVRSLLHAHPEQRVLDSEAARITMRSVARRGLALDIPDAWPDLLEGAEDVARAVDGLTVVLDHLGKPPARVQAQGPWREALQRFARVDGTVAKVSGLHHAGRSLRADALRAAWEAALDAFGPDRLMLGSDWPMTELADDLDSTRDVLRLVEDLSDDERRAIRSDTAERVYGRRS